MVFYCLCAFGILSFPFKMYERELSDARKVLDDTAREKAKLEINNKRLSEENDDLKQS